MCSQHKAEKNICACLRNCSFFPQITLPVLLQLIRNDRIADPGKKKCALLHFPEYPCSVSKTNSKKFKYCSCGVCVCVCVCVCV